MSKEAPSSNSAVNQTRSGSKILRDFIAALKDDHELDRPTVEAIESLFNEKRLSPTNLLRRLEDARGKANV
jgi:hypothetical protein